MRRRRFRIIAVSLLSFLCCSCTAVREQYTYVIVASKHLTESEAKAQFKNWETDIIIYTLRHKGVTIKAHCQAFDTRNHCNELIVGEGYDFDRDEKLRFLTLKRGNEDSWAILGIEEEHVE